MDVMTSQGHVQPPSPILQTRNTCYHQGLRVRPGPVTNVQEKAGWGEGQGGSGSTRRGSDVFAGFTICRAFFLLPLVPPICVCCMETESAFVPITRHSAYALQWAHWGGGRNGRKRWAGRLWRRILAGRHTGAFAASQREEEMNQREDWEVKANTRLGCFSCLNQGCSLRGGTQTFPGALESRFQALLPRLLEGLPRSKSWASLRPL